MPRLVDYPRASLKNSLRLAKAVDDLGGASSEELAADRSGMKVGGGFRAIVSAAGKYGLLEKKQGQLVTTTSYKNYKLAYSEEEGKRVLQECFLRVPVFRQIFDRFEAGKLPVDILDRLLIREFDVKEDLASRVAKYFIDGAKTTGLLQGDNSFVEGPVEREAEPDELEEENEELGKPGADEESEPDTEANLSMYSIRFRGPGLDSTVTIAEADDLVIIDAILSKIRKKLREVAPDER